MENLLRDQLLLSARLGGDIKVCYSPLQIMYFREDSYVTLESAFIVTMLWDVGKVCFTSGVSCPSGYFALPTSCFALRSSCRQLRVRRG